MKKKIAIEIDFLIRDWIKALTEIYKKQIDETIEVEPQLSNLWEYYPFPVYIETENDSIDDSDVKERVLYIDESQNYKPDRGLFNNFMLDNVLEIFGHAKEVSGNPFTFLNKFSLLNNDIEITLFSKVNGKARPSTLFFLSKYSCEISNIKFIKEYEELIDSFEKIFLHICKKPFHLDVNKIVFIDSIDQIENIEL